MSGNVICKVTTNNVLGFKKKKTINEISCL